MHSSGHREANRTGPANESSTGAIRQTDDGIQFISDSSDDPRTKKPDPAIEEALGKVKQAARQLLRVGRAAEAEAILLELHRQDPNNEFREGVPGLLAIAYLEEDRIDNAYALYREIRRRNAGGELDVMGLDATSALEGDVYPGLKEYCDDYILRGLGGVVENHAIPSGSTLREVQISACLALGLSSDVQYPTLSRLCFRTVVRLDPCNAVANYKAGDYEFGPKKYAEAAYFYRVAAANASTDRLKYESSGRAQECDELLKRQRAKLWGEPGG